MHAPPLVHTKWPVTMSWVFEIPPPLPCAAAGLRRLNSDYCFIQWLMCKHLIK